MQASGSLRHLITPTYYGLNKSFSKKVLIGLQKVDGNDELCPLVKILSSNDSIGICFNLNAWKDFQSTFSEISEFFQSHNHGKMDQKIVGYGFTIRFTTSHSEKSIEIEEEDENRGVPPIKRYRKSVVMKQVTFDGLYKIATLITLKMNELLRISSDIKKICDEVIDYVYNSISRNFESQISTITERDVDNYASTIDENVINEIASRLKNVRKYDIEYMFNELISVNTDYIVSCIKKKYNLE